MNFRLQTQTRGNVKQQQQSWVSGLAPCIGRWGLRCAAALHQAAPHTPEMLLEEPHRKPPAEELQSRLYRAAGW